MQKLNTKLIYQIAKIEVKKRNDKMQHNVVLNIILESSVVV